MWVTGRPSDRTDEDLEVIYKKLKSIKLFRRIHPSIVQQLCFVSYVEHIDKGVVRKYELRYSQCWLQSSVSECKVCVDCIECVTVFQYIIWVFLLFFTRFYSSIVSVCVPTVPLVPTFRAHTRHICPNNPLHRPNKKLCWLIRCDTRLVTTNPTLYVPLLGRPGFYSSVIYWNWLTWLAVKSITR